MKNTEKVLYYCERKWQTRVYPLHEVRGKLPERGAGTDDEITRRGLTGCVLLQRAAMPDADDEKLGLYSDFDK